MASQLSVFEVEGDLLAIDSDSDSASLDAGYDDDDEENFVVLTRQSNSIDSDCDEKIELFCQDFVRGHCAPDISYNKPCCVVIEQHQQAYQLSDKVNASSTEVAVADSVEIAAQGEDPKDEFSLDDETEDKTGGREDKGKIAIQAALRSLHIQQQSDNSTVVDFSTELRELAAHAQAMQREAALAASAMEVPQQILANDQALVLGYGARIALQEIVQVYASGLGDQEVHLLDLQERAQDQDSQQMKAQSSSSYRALDVRGPLSAIAEVEEEEEKEPAVEQQQRELKQRRELEEDGWASLPLPAPASAFSQAQPLEQRQGCSYASLLASLQQLDLQVLEPSIVTSGSSASSSKGWLARLTRIQYAPLPSEQLRLPFLFAQLAYDPAQPCMLAALRQIYAELMQQQPEQGQELQGVDERWERLGFQGRDPRTDLNRSMQMLAVLQALHLLESNPALSQQLFQMSQSASTAPARGAEDSSWPFMCVGVMFTKEALQALRNGALDKPYHQCPDKDVLAILHLFYEACFFDFGLRLLEAPAKHHALLLGEVRKECAEQPRNLLKRYKTSSRILPLHFPQPKQQPEEHFDDLAVLDEQRGKRQATVQQSKKAARFLVP
jgi:hypothetical protein